MKVIDSYQIIPTESDCEELAPPSPGHSKPNHISKRRNDKKHISLPNCYKLSEFGSRILMKIKFQKALNTIKEETCLYGTSNHISDMSHNIAENIEDLIDIIYNKKEKFRMTKYISFDESLPWYLINPTGYFKQFWTYVYSFVLLYTALVMPYRLAFIDPVFFDTGTTIEVIIDCIFILDIFLNFFTPFYDKQGNMKAKLKDISKNYMKGPFVVDVIASVPYVLIEYYTPNENTYRYNSLLRLFRVPRLYKLLRIIRLAKFFKYLKRNQYVEKIQDFLSINSRVYKLVKFLMTIFLCVHVFGCIWYFSAKLEGFGPDTWPVRAGYADSEIDESYLASIYWAFATVTTVGYGDISASTSLEQIISIVWMILGVGFYSVTVGSLSSFFSAIDTSDSILSAKLAALHEFSKEAGLSKDLKLKIKQNIRYSTNKVGTIWSEKHSIFGNLSKDLKNTVANSMYGGIFKQMWFFKDRDPSFIVSIVPFLKPVQMSNDDYLYREGQYANEVYFIISGRINLVINNGICYKSFLKNSHIGEVEILLKLSYRENNAQACGKSEIMAIDKSEFLHVLERFENEKREIMHVALQRRDKNANAKQELLDLIHLKERFGDIDFLVGKEVFHEKEKSTLKRSRSLNTTVSHIQEKLDVLEVQMEDIIDSVNLLKDKIKHK